MGKVTIPALILLLCLCLCGSASGQAQIFQADANYALTFFLGDGNGLPMTGKTVVPFLSKGGGAWAAASGACSEVGKGVYKIAGNATDTGTLGVLLLDANYPDGFTTERTYHVVRTDPQNSSNGGMSNLVNRDANLADIGALAALAAKETSVKAAEANAITWAAGILAKEASVKGIEPNAVNWALGVLAREASVKAGEANSIGAIYTRGTGTSTLALADVVTAMAQAEANLVVWGHSESATSEANTIAVIVTRGTSTVTTAQIATALALNEANAIAGGHWLDPNLAYLRLYANRDANLAAIYAAAAAATAGTGSGANLVNVIVLDANGNTAIQGAKIRATLNTDSVVLTSLADGNNRFTIGDGTWTISVSCSAYDGNTLTKAVSGNTYQIVKLNRVVLSSATVSGTCRVHFSVYNSSGVAVSGAVVKFTMTEKPSGSTVIYTSAAVSGTTGVDGSGYVDLVQKGKFDITIGGKACGSITVPTAASHLLGNILY